MALLFGLAVFCDNALTDEKPSSGGFLCIICLSGIGALYVRRRPRVRVEAPQSGGGQERGMRSGTVPTPLCVGMGAACELAMKEMEVRVS